MGGFHAQHECGRLPSRRELTILLVKKRRNRIVNMTILLKNLLAKTDLVSKNVSKIGKKVDFGWSLVILTFFTNRWDFEQI